MRNLTSSTLQKRHVSDKAYFRPQLLSRRQITCSGIAQLLDSISVSHAIFSLLKPLILSHNPLRVGVQPKLKHFNKTLRFGDCKSNSRNRSKNKKQKTKNGMNSMTFIRCTPVTHTENPVHTLCFSGRLYPQTSS